MINQVLQEVTAYTDERDYAKHQVVYRNGAPTRGFFYVKSGLIGLYQTTESGKESLLRIYGLVTSLGIAHCSPSKTIALRKSMLPSELLQVNLSTFTELDSVSSNLSGFLVRGVCYELGEAENRLTQMTSNSAKVRIMDAIYHLFDNHPEYQWTYREVGEYSGTDTTTVIRFCKELKGMGILDSESRKLQVSSIQGLKAYRDELAGD